jgi:dihydropyrimidinase
VMTIARGEVVARDGMIVGKKGAGKILERDISAYAAAGETA